MRGIRAVGDDTKEMMIHIKCPNRQFWLVGGASSGVNGSRKGR